MSPCDAPPPPQAECQQRRRAMAQGGGPSEGLAEAALQLRREPLPVGKQQRGPAVPGRHGYVLECPHPLPRGTGSKDQGWEQCHLAAG